MKIVVYRKMKYECTKDDKVKIQLIAENKDIKNYTGR